MHFKVDTNGDEGLVVIRAKKVGEYVEYSMRIFVPSNVSQGDMEDVLFCAAQDLAEEGFEGATKMGLN